MDPNLDSTGTTTTTASLSAAGTWCKSSCDAKVLVCTYTAARLLQAISHKTNPQSKYAHTAQQDGLRKPSGVGMLMVLTG